MKDYTLEDYKKMSYSLYVRPDETTDGGYCFLATYQELPGCMSHGGSPEEAVDNLQEAKYLYLKDLIDRGQSVPLPQQTPSSIWSINASEVDVSSQRTSGISRQEANYTLRNISCDESELLCETVEI